MRRTLALLAAVAMLGLVADTAHASSGGPVLMVSDQADHTGNPRPLGGDTLTGPVAIWVAPGEAPVDQVHFVLDNNAHSSEDSPPWDFSRGALLFTNLLPDGPHTMRAVV